MTERGDTRGAPPVFGCGLPRTGNASLAAALRALGRTPVDCPRRLDAIGREFDAAVNLPVTAWLDELDRRFPDARWVLTTRDEDAWIASCREAPEDGDRFARNVRAQVLGSADFDETLWRAAFRAHHARVLARFGAVPGKLLVLDVDAPGKWEALAGFLGVPVPAGGYPRLNARDPAGCTVHGVAMSPVRLDPHGGLIRQPPRHPLSRQDGYEAEFDFFTLFYDVFWSGAGDEAIALGPPLPGAIDPDRDLVFRDQADGSVLPFAVRPRLNLTDPCLVRIRCRPGTRAIRVEVPGLSWDVAVQPSLVRDFAGTTAMMTMSRDNDPQWIADWAHWHAAECGVDAVVLYDNGSTRYAPEDVAWALRQVAGLRHVAVIAEPAPLGPGQSWADGGRADSSYLQYALLEHARWRFLASADAVLNLDVDELLLLGEGVRPAALVAGERSVALVGRRNIEHFPASPAGAVRRHRDFAHRKILGSDLSAKFGMVRPLDPKWIAAPPRIPGDAVWRVHEVRAPGPASGACAEPEDMARIAHVLPVTGGTTQPWRLAPYGAGPALVEDADLRARLDRVFRDAPPLPAREPADPALALRAALERERADEPARAVELARRALALDPDLPGAWRLLARAAEREGDAGGAAAAHGEVERLTVRNPEWYLRRAEFAGLLRHDVPSALAVLAEAEAAGAATPALAHLRRRLHEAPPGNAAPRPGVQTQPDIPAAPGPTPIPRLLHVMWIGGEYPLGLDRVLAHYRSRLPDWEIRLWTDDDLPRFPEVARTVARFPDQPMIAADMLRPFLLREFGGVYLDLDFWIVRDLSPLLRFDRPVICRQRHPSKADSVNGAFIASPPGHPEVVRLCQAAGAWLAGAEASEERPDDMALGPGLLSRAMDERAWEILPADAFYPFAYTDRRNLLDRLADGVPDMTYAVHLYTTVWRIWRLDPDYRDRYHADVAALFGVTG